jgi:hypothetical protein
MAQFSHTRQHQDEKLKKCHISEKNCATTPQAGFGAVLTPFQNLFGAEKRLWSRYGTGKNVPLCKYYRSTNCDNTMWRNVLRGGGREGKKEKVRSE